MVHDMSSGILSFRGKISLNEGDDLLPHIQRLTWPSENGSAGVRRAISRYASLIENAKPSPPDIVRDLSDAIMSSRIDLIGSMRYPSQPHVLSAIDNAAISAERREKLKVYVQRLQLLEFAKLIEAIEVMQKV